MEVRREESLQDRVIAEVGSPSELRPEFLSQPGVFSVREGDAVVLPCSVRHVGKYPVVWQQGKRVLAARSIIIESDQRLSLVDGHNLRIDGVTLADAAQYSCLVSSKPLIELTHTVDVLYSPKVTTVPESGQLITDQGSNVTLECTAEGNPQPAITWRKQHGTLPSGDLERPGRKLHISRIVREMAGVYECVADNGLGSPGVGSVSLQVQYPPEIEVERSTIYTGEGMEVKLVCTVIAIPPATVSWERQGSPFDPDRHFTPGNDVGGTRHTLTIQNVRSEDFGKYSCHAKNLLGAAHGNMDVTGVADRAVITSGPISTAPEQYELSWKVESFSPVLEYKVAYRPVRANGSGLELVSRRWREVKVPSTGSRTGTGVLYRQQIPLSKLQPATAYELYVQAKNKHGWNAVSDTLHFSTIARGEALESRSLSSSAAGGWRSEAVLAALLASVLTLC
ncbi:protein amalgam-like [Amphibalanus amphitrite]|uniref:protein amalgam-like n=1 Tax=Amphibalanus amphitrite TaxID=1232801 RepID=UPI001C90E5BE|nr:protein amalgam-like [Amphibalanus amphitrite]